MGGLAGTLSRLAPVQPQNFLPSWASSSPRPLLVDPQVPLSAALSCHPLDSHSLPRAIPTETGDTLRPKGGGEERAQGCPPGWVGLEADPGVAGASATLCPEARVHVPASSRPELGCARGSGTPGISGCAGPSSIPAVCPAHPQPSQASAPVLSEDRLKPLCPTGLPLEKTPGPGSQRDRMNSTAERWWPCQPGQDQAPRPSWGQEQLLHAGRALTSVKRQSVWAQGHAEVGLGRLWMGGGGRR